MTAMIEVNGLVRRFGPFTAVDGVSFDVQRGEVLGFLGPNGAGKSTTMKMITGFLNPSAGSVRVGGHDVVAEPLKAKEQIGYLPEGAPAYSDMTPRSFLNFIADIRGLAGSARDSAIERAVDAVSIGTVLEQPIDTLSKGYKRRVGLAQAILHDPPVLILDEPTDGLDPNQKHEVRALIREMAGEKAIVISTHILEEVDAICTRAIIIAQGRILADGTPEQLSSRSHVHNAVVIETPAEGAAEEIAALPRVSHVEKLGGHSYRAYPHDGEPVITEVGDLARLKGWEVARLTVEQGRLDEVFRRVTTAAEIGEAA